MKSVEDILSSLPPEKNLDLLPEIQQKFKALGRTLIVLDDDPTGTQTVYDVPVLTTWGIAAIQNELALKTPVFYILTNSRSLPTAEAKTLAQEIGTNLRTASQQSGQEFIIISRSDSTLRGHFPEEVEVLAENIGLPNAPTLLIPAFLEGGRYTIHDIHYVQEGGNLIPAAETPFARDAAFGYKNSDLKLWTAEKTKGKVEASSVLSISIQDIRQESVQYVTQKLLGCPENTVCIVNAASRTDLETVALALLNAFAQGKAFILRTAASIVPVLAGLPPRPLLTPAQLSNKKGKAGLVIIGSYVPKTSAQLAHLKKQPGLQFVEINVSDLLSDKREVTLRQVTALTEKNMQEDKTTVLYTSRNLITGEDDTSSLHIGQEVSAGLVSILQNIQHEPAYILAKGGITSSDMATKGLGIKRALVWGQILPGVPVWKAGLESKFPNIPYIVFPGNVGGPEALSEIVEKLS